MGDATIRLAPRDLLGRHPLFAGLTAVESRQLLGAGRVKSYGPGEVVFRHGQPGDGMYGVLAGRVLVDLYSAEGKQLIIDVFGPGAFFGEIALLDGQGRTANAVAHEACELLFLSRREFLPYLERHPRVALRTIELLCARLRRTTDLMESSTFLHVPARLARRLLALAELHGSSTAAGDELGVRLTQAELAATLGVTREIVSRLLATWRAEGLITVERGRLLLRDVARLRTLAAGD
jgi:CRP/FNR family transcriptional regulator, cyclic AMP receptor protein